MKVNQFIILIILIFPLFIYGQSIDVENEKFPGVKKLTVKSYNGVPTQKGSKAIYVFDNNGNSIKSSVFSKRKLISSCEYYYNEKELLTKKIQTFDIYRKNFIDTTTFDYIHDSNGIIISKTTNNRISVVTESFKDFDTSYNAQTILSRYNNSTIVSKRQFNPEGKVVLCQRLENDTIFWIEESKYNEFGDKVYSNIPTLLDKQTGEMELFVVGLRFTGCRRYSIIELYEYTYDKLNRWTEKYVIFDGRKILVEKRIFK